MARPKSNFRVNDIPRAFQGLRKAGVVNPRVEYILPDGTRLILSEQPEASPPATPARAEDSVAS
jgi:hypothetical protein